MKTQTFLPQASSKKPKVVEEEKFVINVTKIDFLNCLDFRYHYLLNELLSILLILFPVIFLDKSSIYIQLSLRKWPG